MFPLTCTNTLILVEAGVFDSVQSSVHVPVDTEHQQMDTSSHDYVK